MRKAPEAWRSFWSLQPVKQPAIPVVKNKTWAKNPIDSFVLARLEAKGLTPAPAADRRTLLRRVTFDLTGLPPTPAEAEAFLGDKSPDAYEKVVDRLLASPRYGERWGRMWLDVARYADTKGYVFNEDRNYPNAYTYRDWVINAFNRDLPYDQFVTDQLAADLTPDVKSGADKSSLAALGLPDARTPLFELAARHHRRPNRRDDARLRGRDGRLRPLPRPQVRPDSDRRLLLALRRLREQQRNVARDLARVDQRTVRRVARQGRGQSAID